MGIKAQDLVTLVERGYQEKWGYIWGTAVITWTKEKQDELERKYYSNPTKYDELESGAKYGSKWIGQTVVDCSGLPYWALKKLGKTIYHGSNSIWKHNLSHKGVIKSGMKLPVGAAIFTGTDTDKPHIGTLTTSTCVTEAKGTSAGVVHTPLSNKKWRYWGLYKGVDYDFIPGETSTPTTSSSPMSTPVTTTTPVVSSSSETTVPSTLRKGAKGDLVVRMQELLIKAGESLPKFGSDGDFGNETLKAVKSFQKKHNLTVDGIVGKMTWTELLKYA